MDVIILAGGFGTRLYPLSENTPKALIKFRDKLAIEHILERLNVLDIGRIYILTNDKFYGNFLDWFDGFKDDIKKKIRFICNGVMRLEDRKGALGDLNYFLSAAAENDFLIIASDNVFEFDLRKLVELSDAKDSSCVALKRINIESIKKFSCVLVNNGKVTYFEEKPENPKSDICATACYLLKKKDIGKFREGVKEGDRDKLGNIVKILMENSEIYGYVFNDFWTDIGSLI